MASFWRYVSFDLDDPSGDATSAPRGWAVPWSVEALAERHWYEAVQSQISPLALKPADWQRLREVERPLWRLVSEQRRHRPAVDFWYDALFAGRRGEALRRRVTDRTLISYLRQQARAAGQFSIEKRANFWAAVLRDLQAVSDQAINWTATSKLLGRRFTRQPSDKVVAQPADLPASWRRAVALASERAAEAAAIKGLTKQWRRPVDWTMGDRQTIISAQRVGNWLEGWAKLALQLDHSPGRSAAEVVTREYYWHELTRGLSEAELLIEAVASDERRAALRRRLNELRPRSIKKMSGAVQRDIRLLTGRWPGANGAWHRQAFGQGWSRLRRRQLTVPQARQLAESWGKSLLRDQWRGWTVIEDESADSWQVRPEARQLVLPSRPTHWSAAELLPIIAHELTHVWQSEQGSRLPGLRVWSEAAEETSALAEAGAMATERAVRHYLGGPDQSRQYYLAGLKARGQGGDFPTVMAALARGLARQQGWRWSRVPVEARSDLARQAFRRTLRLYRPTLRLAPSRRLLNEDQLKYVDSAWLADELAKAGLSSLLSVNTLDLTRWPLCRRLGLSVEAIEPFPLNRLLFIIKETVNKII